MTITAMPNISAKRNKECPSGIQVCGKMLNEPHTHQAMVVKRESETTTGTKTADILSATALNRRLAHLRPSTRRTI